MHNNTDSAEILTNKRTFYPVVFTISITSFVTLLNVHSINIALATIAGELDISEARVALIPQSYLITLCSLMLVVGKLADMYNPKRLFIAGLLVFIVTSVLCGVTGSFGMLVAWRAVQGISGAVLQAVGILILIRAVPQELRGKAFGINGMLASLGLLMGASVGGLVVSCMGWHWVFLICVPVCVLCLLMVAIYLPDMPADSSAKESVKIDMRGAVLSMCGLSSLMFGLYMGADEGWLEPAVCCMLALSAALFAWLFYHLKNSDNPILDLRLFSNRPFALSLIIIFITNLIFTGNNFVIPFYLAEQHHLNTGMMGFIFLFFSVAYLLASPAAGSLADRIGARRTIMIGALVCMAAYGLFLLLLQIPSLYPVCAFLFMLGVGLSLVSISGNVFSFEYVSQERMGEATALFRLTGLLGAIGGVNLFSALLSMNAAGTRDSLGDYRWAYGLSLAFVLVILAIIWKLNKDYK